MRFSSYRKFPALPRANSIFPSLLAVCVFVALHQPVAQAATTYNWTNGANNNKFDTSSNNWSTTGGNVTWGSSAADIATFNATPTPTTISVTNTILIVGGLTFNDSGWALSAASSTASEFSAGSSAPFTVTLANGASAASNVAIASSDTQGLLVTGAGTFTMTNTTSYNAFSGTIRITNGATLSTGTAATNAVMGNTLNGIVLDNGTLAAAANITLSHSIFLGPGAAPSGGGSIAQTTAGQTLTLDHPIFDDNAADSLTLPTANLGTVTLTSAYNGYTGATNIQAGTLKLSGGGTISTSSQINIAAGATFDVSAIADYTVANQTLTGTGGTVLGDTILSADATFLANLDPGTPTLHFTGDLDLSALPTLMLTGTADGTDNYTLATFTGNETGAFSPASVAALPVGYTIDYGSLFANTITLIAADPPSDPVPEPASLALAFLGAAAFFARRPNSRRL